MDGESCCRQADLTLPWKYNNATAQVHLAFPSLLPQEAEPHTALKIGNSDALKLG